MPALCPGPRRVLAGHRAEGLGAWGVAYSTWKFTQTKEFDFT